MSIGKILIIIALIIGAIWYFYPDTFTEQKDKLDDGLLSFLDVKDQIDYVETEEGIDIGKILGHMDCVEDSDCEYFFKIENNNIF